MPPHWNTYFTAEDVDAVAQKAGEAGGTVLFGPMDVFEAGRMVMLQDPQGAAFGVWQPKQHIGCRVKQEAGAMIWNELVTSASASAIEFYEGVLGNRARHHHGADGLYPVTRRRQRGGGCVANY